MSSVLEYFLIPLSPVLALVTAGTLLIVAECFPQFTLRKLKFGLALLGPLAALAFLACLAQKGVSTSPLPPLSQGNAWLLEFMRMYHFDRVAWALYSALGVFTLFTLFFTNAHFSQSEIRSEIFALILFIASGMMLLVSANSLLMVFLALELLSLPTYVLVGIRRKDRNSCEAALKYFLFGSLATVLLVFGIALVYAQTGTLYLPEIAEAVQRMGTKGGPSSILILAGMALLTIAIGFKVGIVPFHMWVPDTYQGAPTPITGFMGSAIKLAGFGLAVRLFWGVFHPLSAQWSPLLTYLAVGTMFVGNLAALVQDNLKRIFAYSSISHAGFLLLGVATLSKVSGGMSFLYYYLVVYGLMFLGLFALIALIERETKNNDIYQLSGLGFSHPVIGAALALFALSGAGIPPTAGFFAKYFILLETARAGEMGIVVLALVSSLIGVYYYLRVLVYLYMKDSKEKLTLAPSHRVAFFCALLCAFSLLYLAASPGCLGIGTF